ncbi:MAG: methylmalonyl-CoA mutase [Dethiosulfovibrio peptidovorans]|nr:MAG: methylmalonyl-CoA mutase [Dethiosulfovibrio peptidovorans]
MDLEERQSQPREFPPVSFNEFTPPSYEEWKQEAETALKGAPFEKKLLTRTHEGIVLQPIYTADSTKDLRHPLSLPGQTDYIRGTSPSGYVGAPWGIAQPCDDRSPDVAHDVLTRELNKGADTVHLVLDEASLTGTNPFSRAEAISGISLTTKEDAQKLVGDMKLGFQTIHSFVGASALPLLSLLSAGSSERENTLRSSQGCIGADPIGVLAEKGALSCSMENLLDQMAQTVRWASGFAPGLRTILVRGDVYHDGGGSAVQELAYAMSTGIAYVRALQDRGLDVNAIAAQIRFSFPLGANFFMEIAKLRAARMFWAQVVQAFGGDDVAQKIDLFASTSRFTQSVYDPYVNVLRATTQAFSGVVGGASVMSIRRFDESIRPGTEQSRRIARNIQILLQEEFNLRQPIDPSGGSWYVESLTEQLIQKSWEAMQAVEAEGGVLEALRSGSIQRAVDEVLQGRFLRLNRRADRAVGTNMYANVTEKSLEFPAVSDNTSRKESFDAYRVSTDEVARAQCLGRLSQIRQGEPMELMAKLIEAYDAGAALWEVREALDDGQESGVEAISPHRWTERFEALRRRTEEAAAAGKPVQVFLANMGPLKQHKPRADFSSAFMEVAHFEVLRNDGFATPEEAARAAVDSGAQIAVICSTDDTYPDVVPPLAKAIKAARPEMIVLLAGAPAPEYKDSYVNAGVDDFIHVKVDCFKVLESLQRAGGIL